MTKTPARPPQTSPRKSQQVTSVVRMMTTLPDDKRAQKRNPGAKLPKLQRSQQVIDFSQYLSDSQRLNGMGKEKPPEIQEVIFCKMAAPARFERTTPRLGGVRLKIKSDGETVACILVLFSVVQMMTTGKSIITQHEAESCAKRFVSYN